MSSADPSAHTEATRDPLRPLSPESASLGAGRFLALYEMGQQLLEQREPPDVLRTIHDVGYRDPIGMEMSPKFDPMAAFQAIRRVDAEARALKGIA